MPATATAATPTVRIHQATSDRRAEALESWAKAIAALEFARKSCGRLCTALAALTPAENEGIDSFVERDADCIAWSLDSHIATLDMTLPAGGRDLRREARAALPRVK